MLHQPQQSSKFPPSDKDVFSYLWLASVEGRQVSLDSRQGFQKESFLSYGHISSFAFASQGSFAWISNTVICDLAGITLNVYTKQIFLVKYISLEFYFMKFKIHISIQMAFILGITDSGGCMDPHDSPLPIELEL